MARPPKNKEDHQKSDQQEGLDFLQENEIEVNRTVQNYLKRDKTMLNWLQRTFAPSKVQKLVNHEEVSLAKDALEFKKNLAKLGYEFKLTGMHEKYDMGLKKFKASLREELYEFIMDKQRELANKIREEEEAFFKRIEESQKLCERYAHLERAVQRYQERIEREEEQFFQWLDKIIENYQNIIEEELTKYGIDPNKS